QKTVIKTIPDKGEIAGKDSYVIVQVSGGPETEENKTEYFMESALGKNGSFGYMNTAQIINVEEYYEHYRIEMTDEEELKKQYAIYYPKFGENVYSYKFYKVCTDIPIFDESCERVVDFFMASGVIYEPPEDDEYNDWTDTIKLIPLTEEHQRTVDISSASPDVLYSDSRNCLFSDGTGGLYLYNFENRELMLAVDFLASMELVNSGIAIEENQYGGASIYSSMTAYNDKWIYFSFETKGKEKRGGGFNGRSYYLDVINSKLSISGTSGSLYEAAVTEPIDPAEHPDAISESLAMINKRDFVYMVNSGTDEGKLPMIRLARSINGNVEYFDPFEKALIPQERKAPEEWGLSFTAEAAGNDSVKLKLSCTCDRELTTGSYFIIQKKEVYGWSEPRYCAEYYLNEHVWTDEAIIIPNDSERVITEDWSGLYGELDYGEYRIGKQFGMANGEEMLLFADFYIE
ncbi:MAG: immunoglobulin-like domain-containing protein, partial [Huintestinicola sp.]